MPFESNEESFIIEMNDVKCLVEAVAEIFFKTESVCLTLKILSEIFSLWKIKLLRFEISTNSESTIHGLQCHDENRKYPLIFKEIILSKAD